MPLCSLGSGSSGNATLVSLANQLILIDCGFGVKETTRRLLSLNVQPASISAILVTHEHSDHISGVESIAAKFDIPVFMTAGTFHAWKSNRRVKPTIICSGEAFFLGSVRVLPVAVPHDAREPVQFVLQYEKTKIGVLTDLGKLSPFVIDAYSDCNALLVEANHDLDMLAKGPYPSYLKRRVSGEWGHLNNRQTAELIKLVNENQTIRTLVIGHISQKNNRSDIAKKELSSVIKGISRVVYAAQDEPLDWVEFS